MIASALVFFLLFVLPFIIAPFGVTQFEDPKVIIAEGVIILLFLITLFSKTIEFRLQTKQAILFACVMLLTLVDLLFFKTSVSFFGNSFRMQGIFLLWLLLLFSLLSASVPFSWAYLLTKEKKSSTQQGTHKLFLPIVQNDLIQRVSSFLSTSGGWFFTLLLLAELISMNFLPLNASQRYVGTLGEPNALGAFAIFAWPFAWFGLRLSKRSMLGKFLVICIVGSILLMSDSRSAMIAFAIQLVFLLLTNLKARWSGFQFRLSFAQAAVISGLLCAMSYALPFFQKDPYENRVEVWTSAFYSGMVNPGIGQGFGNIEVALSKSASGLNLPIQYYYVDSSHNIFLDWWVAGGAIGLGILLYIVYLTSERFVRTRNTQLFMLLLGMVTVLSFNPASVVGLLGFWWIIGQGFAENSLPDKGD